MENASSAAKSSSVKKMEIDISSSAKSTSSMDCSPAGSKCSSMDCSPAGSKRSSAGSKMDEDDITPEKMTPPMDCSNAAAGSKTASSTGSSPSVNSPPIAAAAGSGSKPSLAPKKKAELTWELNEDGVKVYTLRCGCGDAQRLMASDGNILRITNL